MAMVTGENDVYLINSIRSLWSEERSFGFYSPIGEITTDLTSLTEDEILNMRDTISARIEYFKSTKEGKYSKRVLELWDQEWEQGLFPPKSEQSLMLSEMSIQELTELGKGIKERIHGRRPLEQTSCFEDIERKKTHVF